MVNYMESVPVDKIRACGNRRYGSGADEQERLKRNIERYGLIEPPVVRLIEGEYSVIAGRRRIAAAAELGYKEIDCVVWAGDAERDGEVALAENVNRSEMHPLEEAEVFKAMLERGEDVKEVALIFSRGASGIYQRVRLTKLTNVVKCLYREGRLKLGAAALVAGLPEADQLKFYEKYKDAGSGRAIGVMEAERFLHGVQKHEISLLKNKKCGKCGKRTRNTDSELFEEYRMLADVCLDLDCYKKSFRKRIESIVKEFTAEHPDETGAPRKIILEKKYCKFFDDGERRLTVEGVEYQIVTGNGVRYEYSSRNYDAARVTFCGELANIHCVRILEEGEETSDEAAWEEKPMEDAVEEETPGGAEEGAFGGGAGERADSPERFTDRTAEVKRILKGGLLERLIEDEGWGVGYIMLYVNVCGDEDGAFYPLTGLAAGTYLNAKKHGKTGAEEARAVNNVFKYMCYREAEISLKRCLFTDDSAAPGIRMYRGLLGVLGVGEKEYVKMYDAALRTAKEG
jgi:ParB/RepB/Spo0J family partition protein